MIGENPEPTEHPRIMKAHEPSIPWAQLHSELFALESAASLNDAAGIKAVLIKHVQGYQPS